MEMKSSPRLLPIQIFSALGYYHNNFTRWGQNKTKQKLFYSNLIDIPNASLNSEYLQLQYLEKKKI